MDACVSDFVIARFYPDTLYSFHLVFFCPSLYLIYAMAFYITLRLFLPTYLPTFTTPPICLPLHSPYYLYDPGIHVRPAGYIGLLQSHGVYSHIHRSGCYCKP